MIIARLSAEQPALGRSVSTIGELAKYMFLPTSDWARRQRERRDGQPLSAQTLREHELNARLHIIPALGKTIVAEVDSQAISKFLYELDMSNARGAT